MSGRWHASESSGFLAGKGIGVVSSGPVATVRRAVRGSARVAGGQLLWLLIVERGVVVARGGLLTLWALLGSGGQAVVRGW